MIVRALGTASIRLAVRGFLIGAARSNVSNSP